MSKPVVELLPPPGPSVFKAPTSPPFTHPKVSPTFLSALKVRIKVFVDEQHCNAENEIDEDDARSWHWVVFFERTEVKAAAGTIRLVPVTPIAGHTEGEGMETAKRGEQALGPKHGKTEMWDGHEPFVKLGRMATLKNYRKLGLGRLLVNTAFEWLESNADKVTGQLEKISYGHNEEEMWRGLVLVHAQKEIERFWASVGFVKDDGMGTWWEEGIEHIAMWKRITLR